MKFLKYFLAISVVVMFLNSCGGVGSGSAAVEFIKFKVGNDEYNFHGGGRDTVQYQGKYHWYALGEKDTRVDLVLSRNVKSKDRFMVNDEKEKYLFEFSFRARGSGDRENSFGTEFEFKEGMPIPKDIFELNVTSVDETTGKVTGNFSGPLRNGYSSGPELKFVEVKDGEFVVFTK